MEAEAEGTAPGRGRLAGRRVLVVGAGTRIVAGMEGAVGNGRAISVLAAREGAAVVCADVSDDAAAVTADAITAEGGDAHVVVGDVGHPGACARLVADAAEALGGLDGVVLNVGILAPFGLGGTGAEEWDRIFSVNTRSHALIAGAALEVMEGPGAFVFMSSISGLLPGLAMPAYDATKAAVLGVDEARGDGGRAAGDTGERGATGRGGHAPGCRDAAAGWAAAGAARLAFGSARDAVGRGVRDDLPAVGRGGVCDGAVAGG